MAESEKELKSLLMRVKEESETAGLKINIQKIKIMATSPITSQQIDGETIETVTDFIFLGSKITADDDCRQKIKRLAPWKKSNDKPTQCIKIQRYHFAEAQYIIALSLFSFLWKSLVLVCISSSSRKGHICFH